MSIKVCLLALILSTSVACAATADKRSFGGFVSDEMIAFNLRAKYMKDNNIPANEILLSVWKGVVTLKGELNNQDEINRAIELAERQKGVREVKAHLVLRQFGSLKENHRGERPGVSGAAIAEGNPKAGNTRRNGDPLRERTLRDPEAVSPVVETAPDEF